MPSIQDLQQGPRAWFSADHRDCDAQWAAVEAGVDAGDAAEAWARFDHLLRRHLDMEEQVLFVAFEAQTGMTHGPTAVMRHEHDQMRALLGQMQQAAQRGDWSALLDQGDTLLMVVQQHNMKEEGMLYPMIEMHLDGWPEQVRKLERYLAPG